MSACGHKGFNGAVCGAPPHQGPLHIDATFGDYWVCSESRPDHDGPCSPPKKMKYNHAYWLAEIVMALVQEHRALRLEDARTAGQPLVKEVLAREVAEATNAPMREALVNIGVSVCGNRQEGADCACCQIDKKWARDALAPGAVREHERRQQRSQQMPKEKFTAHNFFLGFMTGSAALNTAIIVNDVIKKRWLDVLVMVVLTFGLVYVIWSETKSRRKS